MQGLDNAYHNQNQRFPRTGHGGWPGNQNVVIRNTYDLESFIRRAGNVPSWDMEVLHDTFRELAWCQNQEFADFVNGVIDLAESQDHFSLQKRFQESDFVALSRHEVSVLLANAFLCRLRYVDHRSSVNLNGLYSSRGKRHGKKEKLKCLVLYLYYVLSNSQNAGDIVTYRKVKLSDQDKDSFKQLLFIEKNSPLCDVIIIPNESMFDAKDVAQVDFANRHIGGGVLGSGAVQEEIKFITCPELIASKLFPGEMKDDEAIVIERALNYVQYAGYADSFLCKGLQQPPVDNRGPLLAIDATDFSRGLSPNEQYKQQHVLRELKKAFVGFSNVRTDAVATGNWGGGAFKGDAELKFKIQWLAATLAGKKLHYYPYTSSSLRSQIERVVVEFRGKTIRELCSSLNLRSGVPHEERSRGSKRPSDWQTGHPIPEKRNMPHQMPWYQPMGASQRYPPLVASSSSMGWVPNIKVTKYVPGVIMHLISKFQFNASPNDGMEMDSDEETQGIPAMRRRLNVAPRNGGAALNRAPARVRSVFDHVRRACNQMWLWSRRRRNQEKPKLAA